MHTTIKQITSSPSWLKEERAFLDIETTGLCKQSNFVYCIGLLLPQNNQLTLYQWMIDTPEEEQCLLQTFIETIEHLKTLITYSGKQFDIPFLIARLQYYGLETQLLENLPHLDLKKLNLFSLFLKSKKINRHILEEYFHFKRTLEINGRELVKMYTLYQASQNPSHRLLLLTHNQEELMSCYSLYEVYYLFTQLSYEQITSFTISQDLIEMVLVLPFSSSTSCEIQLDSFSLSWKENSFYIRLYPEELILRKYLSPAKDYVYIPSQGQIMHKSVAQFIPKAFKEKVSKDQCYISQKGYYINISDETLLDYPIWYNEEKSPFIAYQEHLTQEEIWKLIKPKITPRI